MQIGVYGLGRFGSFWASMLARHPFSSDAKVVAYSRSSHKIPFGVEKVSEDEVLSSDILYFCVAISSLEEVLKRVSKRIKKGAIILDTCSVKTYPAAWLQENLNKDEYCLIATHPMFGPDSAKNGIKGLPIVLCPISEDTRYQEITAYFAKIGLQYFERTDFTKTEAKL